MNVISRAFMTVFLTLLDASKRYRLLPEGLVPIRCERIVLAEIFAYLNVIAVHRKATFSTHG